MRIDGHKVIVVILFCLAAIGIMGRLDYNAEAENVKCKAVATAELTESKTKIETHEAVEEKKEIIEIETDVLTWTPISEFEKAPVELETKAYTNYKVIGKNSNSAQSRYIYNHLIVCDDGYLRDKDGFVAAALGSYFGGYHEDSIGTRWVFVCKDGTEIPIVKVDVKQNDHTLDADHKIGIISGRYDKNGNPIRTGEYIEFYVDVDKIDGLEYTNSNPCINTTPDMDGVIVGWYQVESERESMPESKSEIELSDYDRWFIECVVAGEACGEPYDGQRAVAQCIYNAMLKDDLTPQEVKINYQYAGWKEGLYDADRKAWQSVHDAVSAVFDNGDFVTDEPILYFYNPSIVYSSWHEAQKYWKTLYNHKFFYLEEDVDAEWCEGLKYVEKN